MANRVRGYFEEEEVRAAVAEELRPLAQEMGIKLQLALAARLGPELAPRVRIEELSFESIKVTLAPASEGTHTQKGKR